MGLGLGPLGAMAPNASILDPPLMVADQDVRKMPKTLAAFLLFFLPIIPLTLLLKRPNCGDLHPPPAFLALIVARRPISSSDQAPSSLHIQPKVRYSSRAKLSSETPPSSLSHVEVAMPACSQMTLHEWQLILSPTKWPHFKSSIMFLELS